MDSGTIKSPEEFYQNMMLIFEVCLYVSPSPLFSSPVTVGFCLITIGQKYLTYFLIDNM